MRLLILLCCAAGALFAGDGIPPRIASTDYPAHARAANTVIAAAIVSASEARKTFGADLHRAGYVVIEVALFPDSGASVSLKPGDFMLRTARPVTARAVADAVAGRDHSPRTLPGGAQVYTSTSIGYETGSGNNRYPQHGVYTATSVGVGIGNPPFPPSAGRDISALERELSARALPEAIISQPIAGYLYFPERAGKNTDYELTWFSPAGPVRMVLPPVK